MREAAHRATRLAQWPEGVRDISCFLLVEQWLRNIKDVYYFHKDELESLDADARVDRLIELNVQKQVMNLAKTSIVQMAWHSDNRPTLHGWVYRLSDGILHNLIKMEPNAPMDPVYTYD